MTADANTKTALKALGVVVTMGSLAWASVPLYDWFCRTTGFGGVTQASTTASDVVLDQTIKVRFDASVDRGFAWEFKPMEREVELRMVKRALPFMRPTIRPIAPSLEQQAIMSPPLMQVATSQRLPAFALKSRCCSQVSAWKCLSHSTLIPRL